VLLGVYHNEATRLIVFFSGGKVSDQLSFVYLCPPEPTKATMNS